MEYKLSKYNTYIDLEEYLYMYNSYSTKIIKISRKAMLYQKMKNRDVNSMEDTKSFKELLRKGFIVRYNEDEELKRKLHINDLVMNNKLVFTILTTRQCNFRCKYCYEKFENKIMSKELIESFINFVDKNIEKYSGIHLRWFGGEPLLALDIVEEVNIRVREICNKKKRKFSSEMLTNAYLLKLKTFERLVDIGVEQFKITIDGTKNVHDSQRVLKNGDGTFTKIIENLKDISNNSKKTNFRIIIRTNISKASLETLEEYLEIVYKSFGKDNRFSFKFKTVDNLEGGNQKEIKKLKIDNANELFKKLVESDYKLNYDVYFDHLETGICRAGKRNNFVLGTDGTIHKCLVYFGTEENNVGYFDNDGNMIIDEAKLSLWIHNYTNVNNCLECPSSARCLGGKCVANRIFKNKVKCNFSQNHVKNIVKLLDQTTGTNKIKELK